MHDKIKMKIEKNEELKFVGKSLYFPKKKVLVLADLHIGYEEYLNEEGVFMPRTQFKETMEELEKVFKEVKEAREIIVLGDLKHEFGTISSQEWREVKEVLELLKKKAKNVILVKGNHDTILEPIAKRKELKIVNFYINGGVCFLHGHKLFPECLDKKIKILVMGHRHPAVMLADEYKREKYKCFLVGGWKGKKAIILPSFFPFVEGSDIITDYEENRLFINEKNLKNFEVFVVAPGEKEVYRFGKMGGDLIKDAQTRSRT